MGKKVEGNYLNAMPPDLASKFIKKAHSSEWAFQIILG
jgi:hypothetical protein